MSRCRAARAGTPPGSRLGASTRGRVRRGTASDAGHRHVRVPMGPPTTVPAPRFPALRESRRFGIVGDGCAQGCVGCEYRTTNTVSEARHGGTIAVRVKRAPNCFRSAASTGECRTLAATVPPWGARTMSQTTRLRTMPSACTTAAFAIDLVNGVPHRIRGQVGPGRRRRFESSRA